MSSEFTLLVAIAASSHLPRQIEHTVKFHSRVLMCIQEYLNVICWAAVLGFHTMAGDDNKNGILVAFGFSLITPVRIHHGL